jgi:alpha-methylacyl-CoA racemase
MEQRMTRGKKSITMNFKNKEDLQKLKSLCLGSDVLLDPFRPGVLESMGLDPINLLEVK